MSRPIDDCQREHAKHLHRAGWPPFPLPEKAKYPPPSGCTGHDGVDLTDEQIDTADWSGNVGVRMPAGVIGIDVDAYKGGQDTLDGLVARLGPLPPTYVSHSNRRDGSGISFFQVPVGMVWVPGLPGIEIVQRDHRYATVAPSIHPEDREYAWLDQAEPDVVQTGPPQVDDLPLLPWSWVEELSRRADGQHTRAVGQAELVEFFATHTAADKPGYFTGVVVARFNERWQGGYSRHDTMQHCLTWAMELARAGVTAAEWSVGILTERWRVAMRADEQSRITNEEFPAMLRHAVGRANSKSDAELHKLHDDAAGITMNATSPPVLATVNEPPADDDADNMVPLIDWTNLPDSGDDIVEGLIVPARWVQFVAAPKAGKSSLTMWVAIQLAQGRDPFDGTPIDPVRILYCDGEMGFRDLEELIRAVGHDPAMLGLPATTERMRLDGPVGASRLLRRVDRDEPQAVFLDGLNGFVDPTASENSDETWRPFVAYTIDPLKQHGIAIISCDNFGKDPTRGARGSSVKADKADAVVEVKRTDKGVRLRTTHQRGGAYLDSLDLDAEGHDRSRPIRYWRSTSSWPVGTQAVAALLDTLGIPVGASRRQVRARLKAEVEQAVLAGLDPDQYRVANDTLRAALHYRQVPVSKP